ncbi:MAG TPA: alanine--tRNA ligase [Parachlamydiales bacterium]|nr:MAG: alanine--tRNA ligase [Chlamydiae bacterium RIFCSPHIGHO2_02_FULL_49_29]OGN63200.1 MAG: alanine--tRNA ligase [Chlamydiae bacterium RIFCSPHIGHO2_12_FULL_49_32]OGN67608.1 MAG: alanine--tRNA ligase [Chlamydiae bacterium RIFCSPLOWO2_02_FULL_49_12]OGN70941.1 MAG: alanine--tRNA ligase [Chlamydiae bacterium RIFCSPLOWO2_12_FULL_49_12]HAZ15741.1 alanine--tRNA ligase [Parachlamydiales bacterium]
MLTQEIRRNFLNYFKKKGHTIVPSSPVVPHEDPTLLFTNAGMNQFKDVFLGQAKRAYSRAASSQKCLRVGGKHNDLDNVGHTSRHMTFFEMLGNFSFGDYFKEEAIRFAFEVSTEIYQLPLEKIWVTVFEEDDEAHQLWQKWIPEERICRMGEKDNFWAMGETGPCGPCSELLFDRGERFGSAPTPKEDSKGERFLEFWNLVFMQYNRDKTGKMSPLPKPCIDTGAGLERIVALKMGVDLVFETDIFQLLIRQIEAVSGTKYQGQNPAFHVISDHLRALAFAIADGAQPSNLDRGYVLRKLLRRAVRYARGIGLNDPFLAKLLPTLIEEMGSDYPELKAQESRIAEILTSEEEAFLRTLKRGGNILSTIIDKAQESPLRQIGGEEAFKLKDTYGFPLEEILLIAKDVGLDVNIETYQIFEEKAKELSRKAQRVHVQEASISLYQAFEEKEGPSRFLGYAQTESFAKLLGMVADQGFVTALREGDEGILLLDQTPFYAEKGGQVGDRGRVVHDRGSFSVTDTQNPYGGVIAHLGKVEEGVFEVGDTVLAQVDAKRREGICNHHTATHLLHWALQQVLGPHIRQAGSLVEEHRLRFDFNHHKALSLEEIRRIEDLVNEKIREARPVKSYELSYEEAQKNGAIKQFFGEKYGDKVRVIDLDYSKELCGGTHAALVGNLGYFRLVKEGSIAAGIRRIEAVAAKDADLFVRDEERLLGELAHLLKAAPHQLQEKVLSLLEENKRASQELLALKAAAVQDLANSLSAKIERVGSLPFLATEVCAGLNELIPLANALLFKNPSLVLLIAIAFDGRCHILARVTPDLTQRGIKASEIIKAIAPLIGGKGGGKEESAQAGGTLPQKIPAALSKAKELIAAFGL